MSGGGIGPRLDFRSHRAGSRFLLVTAALEDAAMRLGLLEPGGLDRLLLERRIGGRAGTAVVALPGRRERLHLRPVHHGGLLAGLWGDRLMGLSRPIAELHANARLREAGAPVPEPALVAGHRRGPLWTAAVATLHEENTLDAASFLRTEPGSERLLRAAAAVGRAVRHLHDAGGRHPDLHLGNVLLRERGDDVRALLVDLDGAKIVRELPAGERMAEIMRLHRSLVKRRLDAAVGRRGFARFLEAYTGRDRPLRASLLRHLPRERLRLRMHALGYPRPQSPSAGGPPPSRRTPASGRPPAR